MRTSTVAALFAFLLFASAAQGASGAPAAGSFDVAVVSCVSGNSHVAARRGCAAAPGAGYEGSQSSGLDEVLALAVSGRGTSLYAVGNRNSSLAQLALGAGRRLVFSACVTGNSFLDTCAQLPGATANAPEAPLSYPTATAISPDGRSLYVASGNFHGSVVARFVRDPLSGALAYAGCITGDLEAGPTGPGGCAALPTATREGFGSGLYESSGIAIAGDGRRVYVTAAGDGSVVSFDRDPASGALTFVRCISSNRRAAGCTHTPGGDEILEGIGAPLISPDGRYLYGAAGRAATVDVFALGGSQGIRFAGCVTGSDDRRPCRRGRHPRGAVQALSNPTGIAATADGRFLYVTSTYGTIVALRRKQASGALEPLSCISSNREDRGRCAQVPATPHRTRGTHHASLLTGVQTPLLIGRTLLAPVRTIDGLVRLTRNARTGALAFAACATGNLQLSRGRQGPCTPLPKATRTGVDSGFYKTTALLPGPGNLLYAAASGDATISLLRP
ncbi:MAG TPA: hypothetical protein VHQ43_10370 [Solirubrobacterales bacterium]|nr:hypothetical protein [Solirubrobacterales bacterium]